VALAVRPYRCAGGLGTGRHLALVTRAAMVIAGLPGTARKVMTCACRGVDRCERPASTGMPFVHTEEVTLRANLLVDSDTLTAYRSVNGSGELAAWDRFQTVTRE